MLVVFLGFVMLPLGGEASDATVDAGTRSVLAHLRALGARPLGPVRRLFLLQGDKTVQRVRVAAGECAGFLALGRGTVRDVDLGLHTLGGLTLEYDQGGAADAYVRHCAPEGVDLYLGVSMYAGQGELDLIRFADAPPGLGLLPGRVGFGRTEGSSSRRGRPSPANAQGLTAAQQVAGVVTVLERAGYRTVGGEVRVPVRMRRSPASFVPLEGQRCYRFVAGLGPGMSGLELSVSSASGESWAGRGSGGRPVVLGLCPERAGPVLVRAALARGRGRVLMKVMELSAPEFVWPVDAPAALRPASADHRVYLSRRGFDLRLLSHVWLQNGTPHETFLPLASDRCHVVTAMAEVMGAAGGIELVVTSAEGRLFARHVDSFAARVFLCPVEGEGGPERVRLRVLGGETGVRLFHGETRPRSSMESGT